MGKVRTNWDEAMQAVLNAAYNAQNRDEDFTVEQAFKVLDRYGMTVCDARLLDVLDDMPVGLDDLVEDEDEDE